MKLEIMERDRVALEPLGGGALDGISRDIKNS